MKQNDLKKDRAYRFKRFVRSSYAAFNSMHKVVNTGVLAGCMLTFAHVSETAAQNETSVARFSSEEQELDELVVTSSKAELTLTQTAKIVTIITREEIAQQPVESLADLLKNVVGIDVRQRGSNGVLSGVSVRGGTFEQTAILLNGANLSNPQTAHYSLNIPVNLSDIERIEIIQGPSSLLYGASAFSGGVNIVTKKNSDTGVSINLEGGTHELFNAEVRGALKTSNSNHSLSVGYNASDGYISNSDYQLINAFWQSSFEIKESKMDIQLGFNDKEYGANTFFSPKYPNQFDDTQTLFASIKGESGTTLKFIPHLYWTRNYNCFQLFRDGTPNVPDSYTGHNYHYTDVFGFNLNAQYRWRAGITNMGGELHNEGIYSNVLGKPLDTPKGKYLYSDSRTNISYFLEHTFLYKKFTLSIGILADYNRAFDDDFNFYPSVNASYWLTDNWKIFTSWNNATRTPTFTDLYYKGDTHKGNSDVQPEESESFDLGVRYTSTFFNASANGFYMKGENLIDWVKENPQDLWESRNLTNLTKTGFETNLSFRLGEMIPCLKTTSLNLGYVFMIQDKKSNNLISNYTLDYLKHKFTAGLYLPIYKNLTSDWQFRWQQREGGYSQYEDTKYVKESSYSPFGLLDVKLNYQLQNWNIYLKINNLFDTYYYDLGNIPQPGFWMMLGANFQFTR